MAILDQNNRIDNWLITGLDCIRYIVWFIHKYQIWLVWGSENLNSCLISPPPQKKELNLEEILLVRLDSLENVFNYLLRTSKSTFQLRRVCFGCNCLNICHSMGGDDQFCCKGTPIPSDWHLVISLRSFDCWSVTNIDSVSFICLDYQRSSISTHLCYYQAYLIRWCLDLIPINRLKYFNLILA